MTQNMLQPLCTSGNLGACNVGDLVAMPVKLYTRRRFTFPMTSNDITANFPPEFELFRATGPSTAVVTGGQTQISTNMMGGDEVPCPFLLCGVCIQMTPEFDSWTASGAAVDTTVAANSGPDTPAYDGSIPFANGREGIHQGTLEKGGATQRAAVHLLLAYRLRFLLQCKYEMFDIPLADIGCVDSAGNFQGSGDCLTPIASGVQDANAQMKNIASKWRFLPANNVPAGPQSIPVQSVASAPTTRVMRGGTKFMGGLAGFYLCPAPILLAPCCRVNMSLYQGENSSTELNQAKYEASDKTASPQSYSQDVWTSGVITGGGPGDANQYMFDIGNLTFGVTMMGFNVTLGVCEQYFQQGLPPALKDLYGIIPNMPGYGKLARRREGLAPQARTPSPFLSPRGHGGRRRGVSGSREHTCREGPKP